MFFVVVVVVFQGGGGGGGGGVVYWVGCLVDIWFVGHRLVVVGNSTNIKLQFLSDCYPVKLHCIVH